MEQGSHIKLLTKRKQLTAKRNTWEDQDKLNRDKQTPIHGITKPTEPVAVGENTFKRHCFSTVTTLLLTKHTLYLKVYFDVYA